MPKYLPSNSKYGAMVEDLSASLETAEKRIQMMALLARELDWLGDPESHPEGSEERGLAETRENIDLALSKVLFGIMSSLRIRANESRNMDLVGTMAMWTRGDAADALHLIRREYDLDRSGDGNPDKDPGPENALDSFAWDTYERVCALEEWVEKYSKHFVHGARQMRGWPMIVSHHVDCLPAFRRIAERLGVGADYPLEVSPRKRRGGESLLLRYLEPTVERVDVLRIVLGEAEMEGDAAPANVPATEKQKRFWCPAPVPRDPDAFAKRIYGFWWEYPEPKPGPEETTILQRVRNLPVLTRQTARDWAREVVVPLVMLEDAATSETCQIPALQNIWRHRSVKSRATFRSRLLSAVSDTLQRYARSE